MSMTAAQTAAFQAASGIPPATSNLFWVGLALTMTGLWYVWVLQSTYKGWASQNLDRGIAIESIIRATLIYMILTFITLS